MKHELLRPEAAVGLQPSVQFSVFGQVGGSSLGGRRSAVRAGCRLWSWRGMAHDLAESGCVARVRRKGFSRRQEFCGRWGVKCGRCGAIWPGG